MGFTAVKMVAFILSLGIDTFVVSVSLGLKQRSGKWYIALTFAITQAAMALIGLLLGQTLGRLLGEWASVAGGAVLIALGIWMFFFDDDEDRENEKEEHGQTGGERPRAARALRGGAAPWPNPPAPPYPGGLRPTTQPPKNPRDSVVFS
jgi:putative Mn2+ efflux pump MntP